MHFMTQSHTLGQASIGVSLLLMAATISMLQGKWMTMVLPARSSSALAHLQLAGQDAALLSQLLLLGTGEAQRLHACTALLGREATVSPLQQTCCSVDAGGHALM